MFIKSLTAFIIGGALCVLAQILLDKTSLTPAKILVSFVVIGVFIGSVGLYAPLFEFAGCGASLPLLGFGGNIAKGVREAVDSDGILGALGGALSSSARGCTVALAAGFLATVFSRGNSKRL